jgi:hypothetical protein
LSPAPGISTRRTMLFSFSTAVVLRDEEVLEIEDVEMLSSLGLLDCVTRELFDFENPFSKAVRTEPYAISRSF